MLLCDCVEDTAGMLVFRDKLTFDEFDVVYEVYKRENECDELEAEYLYDVLLTKIEIGGEQTRSCVYGISSLCESALEFALCCVRYAVTPVSLMDYYEEYMSV